MNHAIAYLFSSNLVNALSHTLAHSLWQGALLSAVTGLIMACTRKSSSALRYNLLVSVMALFAVVVVGTFCLQFNQASVPIPLSAGQQAVGPTIILPATIKQPASPGASIAQTIGFYLNRYALVIVWLWLLMVFARCVQFASGLRQVYNLRHKNTSAISSYWQQRLQQLCGQLGIKKVVGIAQSGIAKTAVVTGHLKPLILIPLGMLTSLSVEEAEAVLLHELAHIRRNDYLVNLLQNMMEIIFFFNPAVLWLSALIKTERENCCDDIAVARSGKLNYLKALVACEEYKMQPSAYAMALNARNGSLKKRAARIISNKNQALNGGEKSLLAVCLIAVGIFATAFANGGAGDKGAMAGQQASGTKTTADGAQHANDDTALTQKTTDTTKHHANAAVENTVNNQQAAGDKPKSDSGWKQSIINDMLSDGIITGTNDLSFKIGTDEFVVNYQKQPEAVYQKYRAKYVLTQHQGRGDWIWFYQFDTQKWIAMVSRKYNTDNSKADTTTGIFQGKIN